MVENVGFYKFVLTSLPLFYTSFKVPLKVEKDIKISIEISYGARAAQARR